MEWFENKTTQLIALVSIVGTLAGFGYTGATYVNRLENLEAKIEKTQETDDGLGEIEKRFESLESSVNYVEKSIDENLIPRLDFSEKEATPEQMLELKKAEQAFEVQMKELEVDVFKLEVADTQDARGKFSKDWTARIMGTAVVGGFMGYIFLVTLQPPEQNSEALINLVLGYLGGLASAVISFYFGASHKEDK
jgi:hypothetical protein